MFTLPGSIFPPHAWLIKSPYVCTRAVLNYLALLENIGETLTHLVSREEWMLSLCVCSLR